MAIRVCRPSMGRLQLKRAATRRLPLRTCLLAAAFIVPAWSAVAVWKRFHAPTTRVQLQFQGDDRQWNVSKSEGSTAESRPLAEGLPHGSYPAVEILRGSSGTLQLIEANPNVVRDANPNSNPSPELNLNLNPTLTLKLNLSPNSSLSLKHFLNSNANIYPNPRPDVPLELKIDHSVSSNVTLNPNSSPKRTSTLELSSSLDPNNDPEATFNPNLDPIPIPEFKANPELSSFLYSNPIPRLDSDLKFGDSSESGEESSKIRMVKEEKETVGRGAVEGEGEGGEEENDKLTAGTQSESLAPGREEKSSLPLAGRGLYMQRLGEQFICDFEDRFSDVCIMQGDVRLVSKKKTVVLFSKSLPFREEKVMPYTQKWRRNVLPPIKKVSLLNVGNFPDRVDGEKERQLRKTFDRQKVPCDVTHRAPGVFFSAGGWTGEGNFYHAFNDVIIPLYITVQHFHGAVVLIVAEAKEWWLAQFSPLLASLSHYPIVQPKNENWTHCFPHLIVGLRSHGGMEVHPEAMPQGEAEASFQIFLRKSLKAPPPDLSESSAEWKSRQNVIRPVAGSHWGDLLSGLSQPAVASCPSQTQMRNLIGHWPLLVILSRKGRSRIWMNEAEFVKRAGEEGFCVLVLRMNRHTPFPAIYELLQAADVVIGVHGAAITNFVFMRQNSLLFQISPIGTLWLSKYCFGDPAIRFDLRYISLPLSANESSLSKTYGPSDPVIATPQVIADTNWSLAQELYTRGQNVTLSEQNLQKILKIAKGHVMKHGRNIDKGGC